MNSQPKSIEQKFLEAIALNYGFVGDTLAAFLMRFSQENAAKQNSTLVSFIAWNHQQFDSAQKLQDELARICEILKEDGCPIKQKGRGRAPKGQSPWEQVYRWIWEYRFPAWQQQNQQLVSEQGEPAKDKQDNFDELVREVRDRIRPLIQERCGTMRVLDMNQPIGLGEIYTHVNILEKITGRKRLKLADLVQDDVAPENFERFSLGAVKETMPGLEAVEKHSKLMILGKPGAGKTTFLKHLAIQCIGGAFQSDCVPLFITLKDFAEADGQPDLMTFIDQAISAIATLAQYSTDFG